jgi:hypothetical protein
MSLQITVEVDYALLMPSIELAVRLSAAAADLLGCCQIELVHRDPEVFVLAHLAGLLRGGIPDIEVMNSAEHVITSDPRYLCPGYRVPDPRSAVTGNGDDADLPDFPGSYAGNLPPAPRHIVL